MPIISRGSDPRPANSTGGGFQEHLKEQCRLLLMEEKDYQQICYLIDSLNENGMLDQELELCWRKT